MDKEGVVESCVLSRSSMEISNIPQSLMLDRVVSIAAVEYVSNEKKPERVG